MRVKQPLFTSELAFLDHSSDFITLAEGQDRGWLDGIVESVVAWCASGSMLQVGFPCHLVNHGTHLLTVPCHVP